MVIVGFESLFKLHEKYSDYLLFKLSGFSG